MVFLPAACSDDESGDEEGLVRRVQIEQGPLREREGGRRGLAGNVHRVHVAAAGGDGQHRGKAERQIDVRHPLDGRGTGVKGPVHPEELDVVQDQHGARNGGRTDGGRWVWVWVWGLPRCGVRHGCWISVSLGLFVSVDSKTSCLPERLAGFGSNNA